ncbi:hypothetical protein [Nostoc sp.]|uniref:hypothetical protein n=1 Tax=Nostoc sp. TaxID=1180 RepID=UPI002FF54846
MLTKEECLKVRSTVHELKEFWIPRHHTLPFYTLGLASPYDVPKDKQSYYKQAKHYNSILREHLGWLYERLTDTLKKFLQAPTSYPDNLALPGFHIFLADKAFEQPMGTVHCDKSYMFHWDSSEKVDFNNPISFTQTVSLPKYGAGIYMWDLQYDEVKGLEHQEIEQLASRRKKSFHPYKRGGLILHSGHIVHQIAPIKNLQPEDERITLQGHGVFYQNAWQLHW